MLERACIQEASSDSERRTARSFTIGNYADAAMTGDRDEWETYASLGLLGKASEALDGLGRFDHQQARFYSAVAHWIDGDDDSAARILENLEFPHAQNLLALIRKPQIRVLAQMDGRSPLDLFTAAQADGRFEIQNIGFWEGDRINKPYADVHCFYDPRRKPDFYLARMAEWHLLPPNLQELPCPIFGQTSDYDVHIQAVYPWLKLFDELIVADQTEWQDVTRLVPVRVSSFPKAFGIPSSFLSPIPTGPREIDVFISGTTLHPYHPDKTRLLHQLLQLHDAKVAIFDGFLDPKEYYYLLSRTKVAFTFVRHPGGMPTRGLQSLAMGAALAVQKECVLQLYLGEEDGLLTYDAQAGDLPQTISRILQEWPRFEQRARRGAEIVREEFGLNRSGSQYFRFLTFLAAMPRASRRIFPAESLDQKRMILSKGWKFPPSVNQTLREASYARLVDRISREPGSRLVIDMARDLVLEFVEKAYPCQDGYSYAETMKKNPVVKSALIARILELYQSGINRFPSSLVLRFNFVRTALQLGGLAEVAAARQLAEETLLQPLEGWNIDPMEDVFPWDFFSQMFNYREYFDLVTHHLMTGEPVTGQLIRLICAALHYYLSFYTTDPTHALMAVELDPKFPFYRLQAARQLIRRGETQDLEKAGDFLVDLCEDSLLFLSAYKLLEQLKHQGTYSHPRFPALESKIIQARQSLISVPQADDWEFIPLQRTSTPPIRMTAQSEPVIHGGIQKSSVKIDFIYPAQMPWSLGAGFAATLQRMGLLNQAFSLAPVPESYERLFEYLQKGPESDLILVMAGDAHLPFLHDTPQKWQIWQGIHIPKVNLSTEPILNTTWEINVGKALTASMCFDYFMAVDERDIGFLKHLVRHVSYLNGWIDETSFQSSLPYHQRKKRMLFRGYISNDGVPGAMAERLALLDKLLKSDRVDFIPGTVDRACDRPAGFVKLLNSYAAVINLPTTHGGGHYAWGYSGRIYETMACGSLLFNYRLQLQPITSGFFDEYIHFIPYEINDFEPLASQIDYYLKEAGSPEVEAITNQAREEILCGHTTEKRICQMLRFVESGIALEDQVFPQRRVPDGIGKGPSVEIDRLKKQGIQSYRGGDLSSAVESFRQALQKAPGDGDLLVSLGKLYYETGQDSLALAHLSAALNANPNDVEAWAGIALLGRRRTDQALYKIARQVACALDPSYAKVIG